MEKVRGVTLRPATPADLGWLNSAYERVAFLRSDLTRDRVVIAWIAAERVGTGRLVIHEPGVAELGGMFVEEACRGQGVASTLVRELVRWGHDYPHLYCIPFSHLSAFYEAFGFRPCPEEGVPASVLTKLGDCRTRLEKTMRLLRFKG